jgi:hypothetical protein
MTKAEPLPKGEEEVIEVNEVIEIRNSQSR